MLLMDWHWCVGLIIWRVQHLLSVHSACRVWIYNLSIFGANLIQNIENEKKKRVEGGCEGGCFRTAPPPWELWGKLQKRVNLKCGKLIVC